MILEPGLEEYVPRNQFKSCGTADAILISKLLGASAYNQRMADVRFYIDLTKTYYKVTRDLRPSYGKSCVA